MKSKKVLNILKITRPTLCSYVKRGIIKVKEQVNGHYDYDEESVYKLVGIENRNVVIYGRVSTSNQKSSLEQQINTLILFANSRGFKVDKVYKDIASGLHFDRKEFKLLLMDVINHKISNIVISHKDRLTRVSFDMWKELFNEFDCNIIVMNEEEDDDKGIFTDIISLLHYLSMKMYSKRRRKKIEILKESLELDECD